MMFYCIGEHRFPFFFFAVCSLQVIFGTNRMPNVLTGFTEFRNENILDYCWVKLWIITISGSCRSLSFALSYVTVNASNSHPSRYTHSLPEAFKDLLFDQTFVYFIKKCIWIFLRPVFSVVKWPSVAFWRSKYENSWDPKLDQARKPYSQYKANCKQHDVPFG